MFDNKTNTNTYKLTEKDKTVSDTIKQSDPCVNSDIDSICNILPEITEVQDVTSPISWATYFVIGASILGTG